MARRHVPLGRVACASAADLAAIAIAEHAIPRVAWWLPWATAAGGALALAAAFGLIWLLDRRRVIWVPRRRPVPRPAAAAGYALRVDPGWPQSQWPPQIQSRTAITGPSGDASTGRNGP